MAAAWPPPGPINPCCSGTPVPRRSSSPRERNGRSPSAMIPVADHLVVARRCDEPGAAITAGGLSSPGRGEHVDDPQPCPERAKQLLDSRVSKQRAEILLRRHLPVMPWFPMYRYTCAA